MTLEQAIHNYFWQLMLLLTITWYFGFVWGRWWEREKNKDQQDNDEIWW